jgi:hypothetical protein
MNLHIRRNPIVSQHPYVVCLRVLRLPLPVIRHRPARPLPLIHSKLAMRKFYTRREPRAPGDIMFEVEAVGGRALLART